MVSITSHGIRPVTVRRERRAAFMNVRARPRPDFRCIAIYRLPICDMIQSFRCSDTAELFAGRCVPRFGNIRAVAERKLRLLQSSVDAGVPALPAGQSPAVADGRPQRPLQHPHQRTVANLLHLDPRRPRGR
ncbi:hypothetical protein CNECB9_30013 [Cupriavidus necator]|uniref:Uncharacterized protein n=1 Tax=Cupriavidus necator TaxID=106590 RepID=A0A1K0IH89_CUPNE|nr:hypothetical protein CNECB9_30013 [Cupriavidus necator]